MPADQPATVALDVRSVTCSYCHLRQGLLCGGCGRRTCSVCDSTDPHKTECAVADDPIEHVIDRHGYVWRVVRDGGMATRAHFGGIVSIGIVTLETEAGPLVPLDAAAVHRAAATPTVTPLIDELRREEREAILAAIDDLIAFGPRSQAERDYTRGVRDAADAVRRRS